MHLTAIELEGMSVQQTFMERIAVSGSHNRKGEALKVLAEAGFRVTSVGPSPDYPTALFRIVAEKYRQPAAEGE